MKESDTFMLSNTLSGNYRGAGIVLNTVVLGDKLDAIIRAL